MVDQELRIQIQVALFTPTDDSGVLFMKIIKGILFSIHPATNNNRQRSQAVITSGAKPCKTSKYQKF